MLYLLFPAANLDYDSDEDDDIFGSRKKKPAPAPEPETKPAATPAKSPAFKAPPVSIPEAFQVIGGDRYYRMKLPLLQFPFKDEYNVDRYCSIVQMPSGCAEKGIVDIKIRGGVVKIIVNVTRLLLFHPIEYASFFLDANQNPIYQDSDHVKIHGHFDAVKKLKGTSSSNRILYVFEFKPDIIIEGDKVYEETYEDQGTVYTIPGFSLIKATTGKHPQIFAHFEFKQKVDGHDFAQPDSDEDHLEGDVDDSSSSSSSEEESDDDDDGTGPVPKSGPAPAPAPAPSPGPWPFR